METHVTKHMDDGTPVERTASGQTSVGGDGAWGHARTQGPPGALVPIGPAMLAEPIANNAPTDDRLEATDLDTIAKRIREAQWKIDTVTVRGAFEIGGLIAAAAAQLGDKKGAIAWAERECGIAASTAYDYCRIWEGLEHRAWLVESLTVNTARSLIRKRSAPVLKALPNERPADWDAAKLNETLAAIPPGRPARSRKGHEDGDSAVAVASDIEEKGEDHRTSSEASGPIIAMHVIGHANDAATSAEMKASPEIGRQLLHQVPENDPLGTGPLSSLDTWLFARHIVGVSGKHLPRMINRIRRVDLVELVRLLEDGLPDANRSG